MTISVIIPTYNESRHILSCLTSLGEQSLTPNEIIVVDDGSTDRTSEIVSNLKSKILNLKSLHQRHRGAGSARNLGGSYADGDILVFIDADMEFDKDFLKKLTNPIRRKNAQGTFSKEEYIKNWSNPWAKAWNYCRGLKHDRAIPKSFPRESPVFRAILKSEFVRSGGFDETRGYDDDWSLSEKLGYQAVNAPDAIYYHHNPDSLSEIFFQARWQGSRQFKFRLIGKFIHLARSLFGLGTLLSPLWVAIRFLHPPSFLAKIVYELGLDVGIIRTAITGRTSK